MKQFGDIHGRLLCEELEGEWSFLGGKVNHTRYSVQFPGGSWFVPFSADDHSSKRALGMRADVVLLDECDDISPSVYETVVTPWFTEPFSLNMRVASGTPRRGRHGLLHKLHRAGLSEDPLDAAHHSFHATYRDVPEQVSPAAVEQARRQMRPEVFRREWECDFDAAEGLVYGDVFSEDTHVMHIDPTEVVWTEMLIGVDHGWEDPGVILRSGVLGSGRDARIHVLEEVYEQHRADSWWRERMRQMVEQYPRARVYCDPSRPGLIQDFRSVGARIQDVVNDIEDGVAAVADRFHAPPGRPPRLTIDPRCKNLIRELGLYRRKRDPKDPDRYLDTIEDKNNHALDALRYKVRSRFGAASSARRIDSHEARQ
jgi:hypothetical protein